MASDPGDRHTMLTGRPLILVVGMHRSGTSLLTGILQQLHVAVPGELIHGDTHNPEGYYEAAAVTDLQERLLRDLDRWWPGPRGIEPLPLLWHRHPASKAAAAALRQFLKQHRPTQDGAWAIKDPRTSLLLPLWRHVAAQLQIPLRLVLAVRDPAEVVQSLCQRDAEAAGMTASRAAQLWWHHNRQVLRHGQGLPLLCLDYNRWFSPSAEQQLHELAAFVGAGSLTTEAMEQALACIRPEHRRSHRHQPAIAAMVRGFYRQLQAGALQPPSQPLPHRPIRLRERLGSSLHRLGWWDADHYRCQNPDLPADQPLEIHYQLHGRREGRSPHPLAPGSPLIHGGWWHQHKSSVSSLAEVHPWGAAALGLCCGDLPQAAALLKSWLNDGIPAEEAALLSTPEGPWLNWPQPTLPPTAAADQPLRLSLLGAPLDQWPMHGWLNRIQGLNPAELNAALARPPSSQETLLLLNARPLAALTADANARQELINATAGHAQLLEARPEQLLAWQRLQLSARALEPHHNGWLNQPGDPEAISAELGLPAPRALPPNGLLCLGSAGEAWERSLALPLCCIPQFDAVLQTPWPRARLLASWLQQCDQAGLRLVRLNPSALESESSGWLALEPFTTPLAPSALASELAWRQAGRPAAPVVHTPHPTADVLWEEGQGASRVAICISLHNYADRITTALNSAAAQTLQELELIVVDDHSSDGGEQRVLQWLQQHQQRFSRVLLLRHQENAGLAAARNTAFRASRAPWCFVLDADNALLPNAAACCLAVAEQAPATAAVVHPLVEVRSQGERNDPRSLISGIPWQRQQFEQGNVVDAMALIRRSAWEHCGGFHHIPGGWEDFDFWCCLIDAGYHGVLCPQRLAIYNSHGASMIQQHTDQQVRAISRLLQQRHPWLDLPMAAPDR